MKVLIAIDESVFADPIADFVINHKFAPESEFKILHVVEPVLIGSYSAVVASDALDVLAESTWQNAKELVKRIATKLRGKFLKAEVDEEIIQGHPVETIINRARQWKADLIIVGSHGRRGIKKLVIGSVSQAVVANASCSVLIVRSAVPDSNNKEAESLQAKVCT